MKKSSKIIIITAIVAVLAIAGIVIFLNRGVSANNCIGTWEIVNNDTYVMPTIVLYKGGTGQGLERNDNKGFYPITWEIKDNVLNVTASGTRFTFNVDKKENTIKSMQGSLVYKKVK